MLKQIENMNSQITSTPTARDLRCILTYKCIHILSYIDDFNRGFNGKKEKDRDSTKSHYLTELDKNRSKNNNIFNQQEMQEDIEIFDETKQTNSTVYVIRGKNLYEKRQKDEKLIFKAQIIPYLVEKGIDTTPILNKLKVKLADGDDPGTTRTLVGLLHSYWDSVAI